MVIDWETCAEDYDEPLLSMELLDRIATQDDLIAAIIKARTIVKICECGAEKCKSDIHSEWCPKWT